MDMIDKQDRLRELLSILKGREYRDLTVEQKKDLNQQIEELRNEINPRKAKKSSSK